MNEQSGFASPLPSSSVTPIMDPVSPPVKHLPPTWEPLGLYASSKTILSEGSQQTSNPNSPRSSVMSFPKLVNATTSSPHSEAPSAQAHGTLSSPETDMSSGVLGHLFLLFCNVLPSVLLSIVCITLTEAANALQRVVNYLQTTGTENPEVNHASFRIYESPSSCTSNFRRALSSRTPSVSTAKSEICNDLIRRISKSSNIIGDSETGRSRQENLRHLLEELAMELTSSQTQTEAEHAMARHAVASEKVIQCRESLCSPPVLPGSPVPVKDFQQACEDTWTEEKKLAEPGQIFSQADEVDHEDSQSSASLSSASSTKCTEENAESLNHREVIYDTMDEAGPPSFNFMSPLLLPLASSPATEKTEALSQIESPIALPPPLSAPEKLAGLQGDMGKESESDCDTVDRDSVIGARRVLSTSEQSGDVALHSPTVTEKSLSLAFQTTSFIEDYDSDQMIVPIRMVKSEQKGPQHGEPNVLELLRSANVKGSSSDKQESPKYPEDHPWDHFSERDVRCAIEPVDDENEVSGPKHVGLNQEEKRSHDMSSIDKEICAYLKEKASSGHNTNAPFSRSRQRSSIDLCNVQDGLYSTVVRCRELHTSRQNKLIPLQNVGRSQSSAEKPVSDWTETTPYEADKESRMSRRHLSDLSFGVKERQKDMLPKELVPEDFPTDDESSDLCEPAMERFNTNRWKRGIKAAYRDVSECRRLVSNLWKRRRGGAPLEEGLHGTSGLHRVESHWSQVRRNSLQESGVKFDSALPQDTVFRLLTRLCPDCGISLVARKPNHKLKVTVPVPGQDRPLLLSIHLTRQSQTRGTTVVLTRSKDDQSGAARKHIEITGVTLRRKLDDNLEFIEDSFSSHILEDSGLQ
eukprot:TRINITY_DN983_c0_g1_i1.p1 TRINITY_DN983_c0_g1~~TRINITY_DN983_c0_g1_i1.p1  ORF type:complete len:864 (-),score=120.18 TRINITY_DN983_c0_g1_i1:4624-7215(-)